MNRTHAEIHHLADRVETHLRLADRHGGSPSPTRPTSFVPVSMALSGILRLRRTPQEEDLLTPTR
ncbi:hypothetical protein [Streptomyces sp. NPDC018711]|uniref:hypothetical protein n=1 Tax=Streptomyces sp. NPDC018711 TaxID=3365052 RepID=UPI0037AF84D1